MAGGWGLRHHLNLTSDTERDAALIQSITCSLMALSCLEKLLPVVLLTEAYIHVTYIERISQVKFMINYRLLSYGLPWLVTNNTK